MKIKEPKSGKGRRFAAFLEGRWVLPAVFPCWSRAASFLTSPLPSLFLFFCLILHFRNSSICNFLIATAKLIEFMRQMEWSNSSHHREIYLQHVLSFHNNGLASPRNRRRAITSPSFDRFILYCSICCSVPHIPRSKPTTKTSTTSGRQCYPSFDDSCSHLLLH
jgi:hypothetical protein